MGTLKELEQQLAELKEKLASVERRLEQAKTVNDKPNPRWRPNEREVYWFVDGNGEVLTYRWGYGRFCSGRYSIGNVFKTKEEAEFAAEKLKVIAELKEYAREFVVNDYNYKFYFNYGEQKIIYDYNRTYKGSTLCFPSEEIAKKAVQAVGEDRVIRYYLGVE